MLHRDWPFISPLQILAIAAAIHPQLGSAPKRVAPSGEQCQHGISGGGLLLSVKARDAYFRLIRTLTRASLAEELRVPIFPTDAEDISVEKVDKYGTELARKLKLDDVESWSFGDPITGGETPAVDLKTPFFFKDLVATFVPRWRQTFAAGGARRNLESLVKAQVARCQQPMPQPSRPPPAAAPRARRGHSREPQPGSSHLVGSL
jgi:hypothetical protein